MYVFQIKAKDMLFVEDRELCASKKVSISSTFYTHIFCMKVFCTAFFYLHVTREKLPKRLPFQKGVRKTMMKLTPGVSSKIPIRCKENGRQHRRFQLCGKDKWRHSHWGRGLKFCADSGRALVINSMAQLSFNGPWEK